MPFMTEKKEWKKRKINQNNSFEFVLISICDVEPRKEEQKEIRKWNQSDYRIAFFVLFRVAFYFIGFKVSFDSKVLLYLSSMDCITFYWFVLRWMRTFFFLLSFRWRYQSGKFVLRIRNGKPYMKMKCRRANRTRKKKVKTVSQCLTL